MEKALKEKLKNIPKDKYIYQRLNGIIHKYIDKESHYINCETGNAYEKYDNIFLGKISDNLLDLIEKYDYVNGYLVVDNCKDYIEVLGIGNIYRLYEKDIGSILTKELIEANCYKVKE